MEGRNDSLQSRIVLSDYRFGSVACEHMHASCMRCLSQYAGWHHAGAFTSPISLTESDAESDVTSTASLEATGFIDMSAHGADVSRSARDFG